MSCAALNMPKHAQSGHVGTQHAHGERAGLFSGAAQGPSPATRDCPQAPQKNRPGLTGCPAQPRTCPNMPKSGHVGTQHAHGERAGLFSGAAQGPSPATRDCPQAPQKNRPGLTGCPAQPRTCPNMPKSGHVGTQHAHGERAGLFSGAAQGPSPAIRDCPQAPQKNRPSLTGCPAQPRTCPNMPKSGHVGTQHAHGERAGLFSTAALGPSLAVACILRKFPVPIQSFNSRMLNAASLLLQRDVASTEAG